MAALGRRIIDATNCKTVRDVAQALSDFHDAVLNPVPDPGPGPDGGVPPVYTPVYVDEDGNLTSGDVLTTVRIIKGLTTGAVSGGAFSIDGLVSLTDGYTVPAEPLAVVNTIGLSCADNTAVFAIYRTDNTTWETWTDTTDASATYTAGLGIELVTNEFALYEGAYTGSGPEIYGSLDGSDGYLQLYDWLINFPDYNDASDVTQTLGHNAGNHVDYFGMASIAFVKTAGPVDASDLTFSVDNINVMCGVEPNDPETVSNTFTEELLDNQDIAIIKEWDTSTWRLLSSGGTAKPALAIIKGTVPASSAIDTTGTLTAGVPVASVGTLAATATADTFTAGAMLIYPDGSPVFRSAALRVLTALNPSYTDFIGEGEGVMVGGSIVSAGGSEYFVLPTSEIRTRPNYDVTKGNLVMAQPNDAGAEMVITGWSVNDKSLGADTTGDAEWQDDGPCA